MKKRKAKAIHFSIECEEGTHGDGYENQEKALGYLIGSVQNYGVLIRACYYFSKTDKATLYLNGKQTKKLYEWLGKSIREIDARSK